MNHAPLSQAAPSIDQLIEKLGELTRLQRSVQLLCGFMTAILLGFLCGLVILVIVGLVYS